MQTNLFGEPVPDAERPAFWGPNGMVRCSWVRSPAGACGTEYTVPMPNTREAVTAEIRALGWYFDRKGRPYCPAHRVSLGHFEQARTSRKRMRYGWTLTD